VDKKYFTIREVAQRFAVAPSLIRFWEKAFQDNLKPHKTKKGVRRYTQADIHQLGYIYKLVKEKGYSLEGARKVIQKHSMATALSPSEVIQRLQALRSFLITLKKNGTQPE
jgi:DNA-binding transcriptional MerR regulator